MKKVSSVAVPVLLGVLSWFVFLGIVVHAFSTPAPPQPPEFPTVAIIIALMVAGPVLLVAGLTNAAALRDQLPPDCYHQISRDPSMRCTMLHVLGDPIPPDAVDRRWLRSIREAFDAVPAHAIWDGMDPLQRAEEEARRSAARVRVHELIGAARAARGVRLPRPAAVSED